MSDFGNRLKLLRKKHNISQINLSVKIGICQEAISSYERGVTTPSIEVLYKIQKYFNVSSDYLLGLTDKEISISYDELSSFESYLINNFRNLSFSEQNLLIKISDAICTSYDEKHKMS